MRAGRMRTNLSGKQMRLLVLVVFALLHVAATVEARTKKPRPLEVADFAAAWVGHTYVFRLFLEPSGSGTLAFSYRGSPPVVEAVHAWHIDGSRVVLRGDLGAETSLHRVGAAIEPARRP